MAAESGAEGFQYHESWPWPCAVAWGLPKLSAAERARDADAVANPVQIESQVAHPATYYGRGLAPFFFGVSLWVFGLVAFVLMRPISKRGIASGTHPVLVALGGWLPPALLGSAGALLLLTVTDLLLGLAPVDLAATAGVSVLAVCAFTALAQPANELDVRPESLAYGKRRHIRTPG